MVVRLLGVAQVTAAAQGMALEVSQTAAKCRFRRLLQAPPHGLLRRIVRLSPDEAAAAGRYLAALDGAAPREPAPLTTR